jgi:hypothetical protein
MNHASIVFVRFESNRTELEARIRIRIRIRIRTEPEPEPNLEMPREVPAAFTGHFIFFAQTDAAPSARDVSSEINQHRANGTTTREKGEHLRKN